MALLEIEDIETYLGRTLTPQENDRAEMLLDYAIGEIESYLGRPVGVASFLEDAEIDEGGRIFLENTPIIDIATITIDNEVISESYWRATTWGVQYMYQDSSSYADEYATVDYTAGVDNRAINSLLMGGILAKMKELPAISIDSGSSSSGGGELKRIRVEDHEEEFEPSSSNKSRLYTAKASPLLIFSSDLDFNSIKRYKRVRTA